MARIGNFTATPDGFTGSIKSLRLSVAKVVISAIEGEIAKGQPAYRVFAQGAEIGAAWKYTSAKGADYLSVSLDDPSFPAPVSARLFASDDGFDLVWNRPRRKGEPEHAPEPDDEA